MASNKKGKRLTIADVLDKGRKAIDPLPSGALVKAFSTKETGRVVAPSPASTDVAKSDGWERIEALIIRGEWDKVSREDMRLAIMCLKGKTNQAQRNEKRYRKRLDNIREAVYAFLNGDIGKKKLERAYHNTDYTPSLSEVNP